MPLTELQRIYHIISRSSCRLADVLAGIDLLLWQVDVFQCIDLITNNYRL